MEQLSILDEPEAPRIDMSAILEALQEMPLPEKIKAINEIKMAIHAISPFMGEPVDCVIWVPQESVSANDYNPNSVAPPEMRLLEHSISQDGYTQPVVAWKTSSGYEVVDGFHRTRVGKESAPVKKRVHGMIPVTVVNETRTDRGDRMASTIRHNRARGKHKVESMSDIVVELKRRNWTTERICRDLGMDEDEVLRLCQITGLADLFSDQEFSRAWDVEGEITEDDFKGITDDISEYGEEVEGFRTVNTGDESRIFHTYEDWECYKAGFYNTTVPGKSKAQCESEYREFLANEARFSSALASVVSEWKNSCEHYLTNSAMNRIAWLGQAAACYALGIPSTFRNGFNLLSPEDQAKANILALNALNSWLKSNGRPEVSMEEAYSGDRQSDIY